jgi:hypothetical protein
MKFESGPFETRYMVGYNYYIPFNREMWGRPSDKRDEWAKAWLRAHEHEVLKITYLQSCNFGLGRPQNFRLTTFDWKSSARAAKRPSEAG